MGGPPCPGLQPSPTRASLEQGDVSTDLITELEAEQHECKGSQS